MTDSTANSSPIRIYVLWHPGLDKPEELEGRAAKALSDSEKARLNRGITLARRIYHWFRMETMDGIPVYFRSQRTGENGNILPIRSECGVRNYIIPLVEAHMVSSPEWRKYVSDLADTDDDVCGTRQAEGNSAKGETRVFPVAMESVAYNMPHSLRKLNFIRHVPHGDTTPDDLELLSRLTEVICRDLRFWLRRKNSEHGAAALIPSIPAKIKIFLSHAKADDTAEAIAIKEYIQRETQCEAFFDETDIAAGYDFAEVIGTSLSEESAGLIVIQGDNYADRPWCRKEIRDFLAPVRDSLALREFATQYFIPPVVVVQTMKGIQLGRTIAELGYSPCARWNDKTSESSARFVVTTLLREILFGLFYRVLARSTPASPDKEKAERQIFINRAPDPVMVNRILKDLDQPVSEILHPGYGLSKMEREGLEASVSKITFTPFLDTSNPLESDKVDLTNAIISISVGNSDDILSHGMGDEHVKELLIRLVRPLISAGSSILYAGLMPDTLRPEDPWEKKVDYTAALLQLLVTERDTAKRIHPSKFPPRIFNPVAWHESHAIDARKTALWTDVCTFAPVQLSDTGIKADKLPPVPQPPEEADLADDTPQERKAKRKKYQSEKAAYEPVDQAKKALSLSAMRRKICNRKHPLLCRLPDSRNNDADGWFRIRTSAHILIGGKTRGFSGIMPGVFEEALYAFEAGKPVFLIAEGGGAAALLARWLVDFNNRPESPPDDFSVKPYRDHPGKPSYASMLAGLKNEAFADITSNPPGDAFNELWEHVRKATTPETLSALLKNGLKADDNMRLLHSVAPPSSGKKQKSPPSTQEICSLVWKGLSDLHPKTKP